MSIAKYLSLRTLICLILGVMVIGWFPTPTVQAAPAELPAPKTNATLPPKVITITSPDPTAAATDALLTNPNRPSLITQAITLSLLALMPFIVMILTSFLKIVVVLSLLRTALGVQQAPPNQIINGVAFMLSLYIMYPTGLKMYEAAQQSIATVQAPENMFSPDSSAYIITIAKEAREPLREFLKRNSSSKHQILFYRMAYRLLPEANRDTLKPDDFITLVPAYITSQLKDAFEIGVLIYIPFL